MVKLSDLQVALLLDEVACAMRVGTPVIDSMRRLESRRLGRVAQAAENIAGALERGESVAGAFLTTETATSQQAAAAIAASKASGDPGLIERMAGLLRHRSAMARDTKIAWFYPWILLLVGYVVGVLVMAPMVRAMHGTDVQWPHLAVSVSTWVESNWWLPPLLVIVLFVVFLGWLYSKNCFSRPARLGLFCNSLADQFSHDVPEDVAIRAAAEISGDRDLTSMQNPTLQSPPVARLLSSTSLMAGLPNLGTREVLVARLRYLGAIYTDRAQRRGYFWSRVVPRTAMVFIGAGLTLGYAWWVIAPVYVQVAQW